MKLAQFLYQHDLTDAEFAALIGVSRSLISRYRGGSRIPGKAVMLRIYRATQGAVCPNDFYDLPSLKIPTTQGARG